MRLSPSELDTALGIVESEGASDFFPDLFEIRALRSSWDKVGPVLAQVELLSYEPKGVLGLIAPKQRFTVRPAHLLDPVDTILYTALTMRFESHIRRARGSLATRIFSHPGDVFDPMLAIRSDWEGFRNSVESKVLHDEVNSVATADIVDFFPRAYLHRVENALDAISGLPYETRALMRLVEKWANGTSYGIPTGPVASGIIAEALLHEVDEFLASYDIDFVRYVDDYVIFSADEASSQRALFVLGQRLHETQGLSLNMAKTRVYKAVDFLKMWSRAGHPDAATRELVLQKVFGGNSYADVDYDELTPEQKELIDALDVKALLEDALSGTHVIDLAAVRFVLNVLTAFRRPELIDPVLANLDRLAPVSSAVARFLDVFDEVEDADRRKIAKQLIRFWSEEKFVSDYQLMWLLEPFTKSSRWNHLAEMRKLAREGKHRMIRRQAILALGQLGDRSSLLDVRARLGEAQDWEQRAVLYACRKLPKDERSALFSSLKPGADWKVDNLLLKATIKLAESEA